MEIPTTFIESDGSVVVNFGILTGREATLAEVDRLARSVSRAGGEPIRIVARRTQEYAGGAETVMHQVVARADGIGSDVLERLCDEWVRDCADDRRITPL